MPGDRMGAGGYHGPECDGVAGSVASAQGLRRKLKQEAGRAGLDMLIKSNYDPYETIEIFEHLSDNADTNNYLTQCSVMIEGENP